jgi:hypothetical protein
MESGDLDEVEGLSAADALARAKAAREAIARRVNVRWAWDAFMAVGTGLFLFLIVEFPNTLTFLVLSWPIAGWWLKGARQRRVGVVSDGSTSRTSDPLRWWVPSVALVVGLTGIWTHDAWAPALPVAAVGTAAILFVGFRWINRRAITRIRNAP